MEKKVDIKFNASDGGSFEKFASKYKDLLKNMGGSGNYASNQKYVFAEMDKELEFYNKKVQKEKDLFNQKKRQLDELNRLEQNAQKAYKDKFLFKEDYDKKISDINSKRRDILSGTGSRKYNTFVDKGKDYIDDLQSNLKSKTSFMDETNNILRQILNEDREDSQKTIKDINNNKNSTPAEKMAAELASQQIKFEQQKEKPEPSLLNTILSFDNLKTLLGGARQYAKSETGFDMIGQTGSHLGQLLGTIIGAAAGTMIEPGGGTAAGGLLGANIGGQLGEMVGGSIGEIEQKKIQSIQEYQKNLFAYRALTGATAPSFQSVSSIGMSPNDLINLTTQSAQRMGTKSGAQENAYSAALLSKGFGVTQETTGQIMELMRSMSTTDRNLMNLVGGVWDKGQNIFKGDRTYLNEFMTKNFSSLQKELTKNQFNVSSGTTFGILDRFNAVGGQFGAQHQNSLGLIDRIQNSLVNPTSDNSNALSFNALRQLNPGAGIFDILKMRQKGIMAPGYLKAMFNQVKQIGGTDDMQKYNLAGMLGMTDNLDAVDQLWKHKDTLLKGGNFNQSALKSIMTNDKSVKGLAETNTTKTELNLAQFQEKLLTGTIAAIEQMAKNIGVALHEVLDGTEVKIDNQGRLILGIPKANVTKNPVFSHGGGVVESTDSKGKISYGTIFDRGI